jgi:hypothetical protein
MGRQWPGSVVSALRCTNALVALMAIGTVLTVVLEDDLIRSWAERNAGARRIIEEGGIEALRSSSITPPAFVPVVVVLFVVMVGILGVLRVFLREGYAWARVSLVALALLLGLSSGLVVFREQPPLVFVLVALAMVVVDVALLFFLLQRDTTDYIRGAWLVHHDAADI